ncbi:IMV membrane protein entry/fusion complex component (Cop-A21L) [Carp edema virus]|nr:IMV membrane protein entry/fusion complex component (Cop-A21L) [Carp edema virus]
MILLIIIIIFHILLFNVLLPALHTKKTKEKKLFEKIKLEANSNYFCVDDFWVQPELSNYGLDIRYLVDSSDSKLSCKITPTNNFNSLSCGFYGGFSNKNDLCSKAMLFFMRKYS